MKLRSLSLLLVLSMGHVVKAADADGAAATGDAPAAAAPSDRELARQLFSAAVALVKAGRYAAAKSLFLEAYAAAPHYLVRYNIAQAELRLGELAPAAKDLRLFLEEGGNEIDATRRARTEAEIARIEAEMVREVAAPSDSMAASILPSLEESTIAPTALATNSLAEPSATPMPATLTGSTAPLHRTATDTEPSKGAKPPAWTYAVITGGLALLGSGVALYVWNDGRYSRWREENTTLLALKQSDLVRGTSPADAALFRDRARRNDARLASVKRFDPVPVVTGAIGLAAMGLGLWALIDTGDDGVWQVFGSVSQPELGARLRW